MRKQNYPEAGTGKILIGLFSLFLLTGYAQFAFGAPSGSTAIRVSDDIELIRLSSNAYIHVSVTEMEGFGKVSSNGLILVDKGKAFLFDTPVTEAQTETLTAFVTDSLHAKIIGFVAGHWHGDCIGGLGYLNKLGVISYANQMTIDIAKERGLPIAKQGFKDSLSLKLNNIQIKCYYLGGGHSTDNIVVWIPSEKILFAGCLVKDMASKGKGNLSDADVREWPQTIKKMIDKFPSSKIVIPGHGQYGGRELLTHTQKILME
ncbi:MAG: subclass B1 metallo-beta-lactamase [Chitinispirillales bacterium]|jgi:metallo-beta-lactamase class B|nr:subclass B1 metallo-beta-lactamase [Chitinispirillales bacterium]